MQNMTPKSLNKLIEMKSNNILITFLIIFTLSFIQGNSQNHPHPHLLPDSTYYISSSHPLANDSNPGTEALPWKTPNNLNYWENWDITLPNTRVLFKKGDQWEDTGFIIKNLHGSTNEPFVIGAYGSGANPIISGISRIDTIFYKLQKSPLGPQIQNIWYCKSSADPGRIFDSNNEELMKGYDVRFDSTWVYNATSNGSIMSYNKNKYDLGQYPYSLLNDCNSPIIQGNSITEKNRWMWISDSTYFRYNNSSFNGGMIVDSIPISNKTLLLYSETNPNEESFYKATNSDSISWKSTYNVQILQCNNILIENIDFQGGRNCIAIGNMGENVPETDDISKNIEIRYCNIGKNSQKPLEIRNAENIRIHHNIFNSGFIKKIGLSKTNCGATIYNLDVYPNQDNPSYWYTGSDRGTGDAVQLSYYAINCEINDNQFINWSHAAVQLNTWKYDGTHTLTEWNVSGNKIYNNYISSPNLTYGRAFTVFGNKTMNNDFYNNLIQNTTIQSQIAGINNSFHHNVFQNITQSAIRPNGYAVGLRVIPTQPDIQCTGNKFDNNTFINCKDGGLMITSENLYSSVYDNYFRNNIIYNSGSVNSAAIVIQSNAPNLSTDGVYGNTYLNNLVYNNSFGLPNAPSIPNVLYHGSPLSIQEWENPMNPNDMRQNVIVNNLNENPQFINIASSYKLQDVSPCRNSGDISIILDENGNLLNNNEFNKFDYYNNVFPNEAPDIGAVEINPVITKISDTDEDCNKILPANNTRVDFYPIDGNTEGYTIRLTDSDFNYLEFFRNSTFFYLSDYYNVELRDSQGNLTGEFIESNRWYGVKIKKGNFNPEYNYSNFGGHCNIKSPNISEPLITNKLSNKDDNLNNSDIVIYPNPSEDILTVSNHDKEIQIQIFSLEGKRLINKKILKNDSSVNVSQLATGTYIIEIYRDNEVFYKKFIKK